MTRRAAGLPLFVALVVGLPLAGVAVAGKPLARYTEFPPLTRYVAHAPFAWPVFLGLAALLAAGLAPFVLALLRAPRRADAAVAAPDAPSARGRFPWWGWAGALLGTAAWVLAWNRFAWFAPFQRHTFTPLWLAYILVVNALTFRRAGRCLLTARPCEFLALFPLSAAFWWFFEYLNRFVQNWHYVGVGGMSRGEYVLFATVSFSTVLPAVLSTEERLATFGRRWEAFRAFAPVRVPPRAGAWAALLLSSAGLAGLGVWPNALFPLVWFAPFALIVALQALAGRETLLTRLREGDWRRVVRLALAALICGFFWEMWNDESMAKWIYTIPYVDRFHLFEMPILGYAGYLPFGLECALAAEWVLARRLPSQDGVVAHASEERVGAGFSFGPP